MILACPSCSANNRLPASRVHDKARCAQCKKSLLPLTHPVPISSAQDFDELVRSSPSPVLVDFWADWCMPCRMAAPEVKHVAHDLAGRAVVLKVDTERSPQLAARYNVRGIPNFAVFKAGKLVRQQAGLVNRDVMRSWLTSA